VKYKCKVEYSPFLSLLCPWCLDGHGGGQVGLDYGEGHDASLLTKSRRVQGPTQPPREGVAGSLSRGIKSLANYDYFYVMP
jgi:hypothetical protein